MFDAYTVKKVLPRLVVAVVLIQLSWFIFTGMITLTTAVAYGVQGLIYAPFGPPENFELDTLLLGASSSDGVVTGGTGVFVALALAGGTTLGILGGALTLALGALLAILIGFALLMFRQVLVVALLLISPLALVAWILPNTEKFWKIWWESFSKLLLVFPMIVAVVAVGRVFAYITAGVNPGDSANNLLTNVGIDELITIIFVVVGFFGPFFLIPKLFALAGSAFTLVSGGLNDRSRGAFDRLKKSRQARQAQRGKDFLHGNLAERSAVGRRINRIGGGLGAGVGNSFGIGGRGQQATKQRRQARIDEVGKENAQLQQLALNNDDGIALLGLSGGTRQGFNDASAQLQQHWYEQRLAKNGGDTREAQQHAAERVAKAQDAARAVGVTSATAGAAFNLLAQNKARSLGAGANGLVQAGAERLGGGDADAAAEALGGFQYHARNAGRFDIGDSSAQAGWERGSLYQLANGHPDAIKGAGQEILQRAQTGDPQSLEQAAIFHQELKAMLPNATGQNRDAILEQMAGLEGAGVLTWAGQDTGRIDPATGAHVQVAERVAYNASNPAHAGWTPEEINIGSRVETRNETNTDRVSPRARTYRTPAEENR